jgi:hypothetical protein
MNARQQRSGGFQSTQQLIRQTLDRDLEVNYQQFNQIVEHWSDIVGLFLAERISPYALEKRTLVCYVSSSSLAQEILFLEKDILKKLQSYSFGPSVQQIRFTTQTYKKRSLPLLAENSQKASHPLNSQPCELTASEIDRLESAVCSIQDPLTRERILGFLKLLKTREKKLIAQHWKYCNVCKSFYTPEAKACFYCR